MNEIKLELNGLEELAFYIKSLDIEIEFIITVEMSADEN